MAPFLEIAVAQCPAELDDPRARLSWLEGLLETHEGPHLDLVVLPELFQCGYNIGDLLSARAEAPDGPFYKAIAGIARRYKSALLYGFAERQGDTLFNTAQCVDKDGVTIGKHRKLLLPPGFESDHFASGTSCELFSLGGFKLAILVCYDAEFPENLRHVAQLGADIVVVPTALASEWGVVSRCVIPARAFENGVFVCYANYCGTEHGLSFFGGSCIIAPDGSHLALAGTLPELACAKVELAAVSAAQKRLPYLSDRLRLPWSARD